MTSSSEKFLSILIVVVVVVVIIYLIKKNKKPVEPTLPANVPQEHANVGSDIHTTSYNSNTTLTDELADEPPKESFTSIQTDTARIHSDGSIVAPKIFTDGYSSTKIANYKNAIMNDSVLETDAPVQELAIRLGDNFSGVYDKHLSFVTNKKFDDGGVKSHDELSEMSRNIGVQSNASTCMMSRGGSGRAKLVLDPLGTAGVMDEMKLPERQRDHKINMVSQLIHIPGYDIDTNNITEGIVSHRGGWSKDLAPKTEQKIAMNSGNVNETVVISTGVSGDQIESFSFSK